MSEFIEKVVSKIMFRIFKNEKIFLIHSHMQNSFGEYIKRHFCCFDFKWKLESEDKQCRFEYFQFKEFTEIKLSTGNVVSKMCSNFNVFKF